MVHGVDGRVKPDHDEHSEITTGLVPGTYAVPREAAYVSIGLFFARTGLSVVHGVDGRVKPDHDDTSKSQQGLSRGLTPFRVNQVTCR